MARKDFDGGEDTRDRIVEAAWSLFQRKSTSGFTLAELAERVGLHYTVLYHYFENKSDLETEIIERHCAARLERLASLRPDAESGMDLLAKFIHEEMRQPPTNLLAKQYDVFADPYRTRVNQAFERTAAELQRVVEAGVEDGGIRPCRPAPVAATILRILNRYANQNEDILSQAGLSTDELGEQITLFVSRGILADTVGRGRIPTRPLRPFPMLAHSGSNLDLILRTLTAALNERGYASTSIPDVAASIGLSKTSFYRFAASKEELLYLAAHRTLDLGLRVRQLARALAGDPLETLLHMTFYARYLLTHEPGPTMRPAMFEFLAEEHARAAWDIFTGTRFDMIALIDEGIAGGCFRAVDARAVQPMITAILRAPIEADGDASGGFLDEVTRLMLHGIAAGGG